MYATCLYCHTTLGANQRVEAFPVGRRLAYDEALGRLWVICGGCGRWNLSPLEERWEAIEECERLYRGTLRRASTENIGLASVAGGLDLVRVGRPLRPELAAWRYGRALTRRRSRDLAGGAAAVGGGIGAMVVTAAGGLAAGAVGGAVLGATAAVSIPIALAVGTVSWLRRADSKPVEQAEGGDIVRVKHLRSLCLLGDEEALRVSVDSDSGIAEFHGEAARGLAAAACARRNQIGARISYVQTAVQRLEDAGGAAGVVRNAVRAVELADIRYIDRLALEMALHEESERRALEGELAALEDAWRHAEEIAAIADTLVPGPLDGMLRRLRATTSSGDS